MPKYDYEWYQNALKKYSLRNEKIKTIVSFLVIASVFIAHLLVMMYLADRY